MERVSKRSLRNGCKYCGHGKDGSPERMYWWRSASGSFILANEDGTAHRCRKDDGAPHDLTYAGPADVAGLADSEDDSEPAVSMPFDPMEAIKVAMAEAMAAKLAEMGLGSPEVKSKADPGPRPGSRSRISAKAGTWALVTAAAEHMPKVLLYGPPGTGKTHLAMKAGVIETLPVYRVNMTEDTPAAELRGHYVPAGDGVWNWLDGPAMRAYRNGGRLVIDEITRAADDALSFLLAVLDGHAITLPTGEQVSPHEDMSVWATTNDGPEALSDALADRFTLRIKCDQVNPEALALLPPNLSGAVTAGHGGGISYREAAEYNRMQGIPAMRELSAAVGRDIAAEFIWQERARDVSKAIEIGTKLT